MLPCYECAYKTSIPGNAHKRCLFAWEKADAETVAQMPRCNSREGHRWFTFPYNYDPVWADACPSFAEEATPEMVHQPTAREELLTLLA